MKIIKPSRRVREVDERGMRVCDWGAFQHEADEARHERNIAEPPEQPDPGEYMEDDGNDLDEWFAGYPIWEEK